MTARFPKLRDDLVIKRQVMGGEVTYLVKNRETNEYLRFREMEWSIVSQLDGRTSIEEVTATFSRQFPDVGLTPEQTEDFVESLKKKELVERTPAERSIVILEKLQSERKKRAERSQAKDIFYLTLATTNPEKFYKAIYPWLRWIWTREFVIVTLGTFLAAAAVIVSNWAVVREGMLRFWGFQGKTTADIVLLFCILGVIVAVHESAHALTCMNFGGEVTELGFMLIYFMPAFYANVSDAYLFDKKWQKYWVTLAGGYSELIICSLCVFTWSLTQPDTFVNHVAYTTMVFAGISTIIFNYNPLIKLDGYYLLSDVLEISNLRESSTAYQVYLIKSRIFRVAAEPPAGLTPRKKRIFFIYAMLSTCYIVLIVSLFVLFLFNFFQRTFPDFGIFLGALAAYKILQKRIRKFMAFSRYVLLDKKELFRQKASVRRWAYATAGLLLALFLFPFAHSVSGPVVLDAGARQALRAETAGFVEEVSDGGGGPIPAGAVVIRLRNADLRAARERADAVEARLAGESARALAAGDVAGYQANLRALEQARGELAELNRKQARLFVRAPFAGTILTPRLGDLVGKFISPGDTMCEFGSLAEMRARIRVNEFNFRELAEGQPVRIKLASFAAETFDGRVDRRSLASLDGYDPVGRTTEFVRTEHEVSRRKEGTAFSHFEVWVNLDNPDQRLRPGMSGVAKITPDRHSLVGRVYLAVRDLLRSKVWW